MVNRSVLIVKKKEPFRQWVKSLPDPDDITLEELNEDTTAYLVPVCVDDDQRDRILRRIFKVIFEDRLNGWWLDENYWPVKRDLATFKQWFSVEFHSEVVDVVNSKLISEED